MSSIAQACRRELTTAPGVHRRQHRSLLASREKQLLVWIARRLPPWVTPDRLSALGAVSMLGVGAAFWAARWNAPVALSVVPVLLLLNWFGDSLDGTVARERRQERPRYGFYLDHVLDIAGTVIVLAGIAASGLTHPMLALTLLVAYLMVACESFLATHARGVFNMALAGFGPTELRIVLACGALCVRRDAWVSPFGIGPLRLFDIGAVVATSGLTAGFIYLAVRNAAALFEEEHQM